MLRNASSTELPSTGGVARAPHDDAIGSATLALLSGLVAATEADGAIALDRSHEDGIELGRVGRLPLNAQPPLPSFMLAPSGAEPSLWRAADSGWWLCIERDTADAGGQLGLYALFSDRPAGDCSAAIEMMQAGLQALAAAHDARNEGGRRLANYEAALDRSELGILMLDSHGDLLFANSTAERLLTEGSYLQRRNGGISARDLGDTIRLQVAIEHVCFGDGAADETPVVALKRRHPLRPLLVCVSPTMLERGSASTTGAVLRIIDPDREMQPFLEPVCAQYRLSPVETRLACELARGATLEAAAASLRIKPQTARSYLKQIFMKTDTNRQSDLIRMLFASTVRALPIGRFRIV